MRLICPNCGAQYEVPADVIPDEGRDVQCSNCGDTWFQASARAPAESEQSEIEPSEAQPAPTDDAAAPTTSPSPDGEAKPEIAPAPPSQQDSAPQAPPLETAEAAAQTEVPEPEATEVATQDEDAQDPEPTAQAPAAAESRKLAPEIARVLREEAEREAALRASQRNTLETQTELGLNAPQEDEELRAFQAQERISQLQGRTDPEPKEDPHLTPGPRRALLPDIEEINSTLTKSGTQSASSARRGSKADSDQTPRRTTGTSGFTRGFVLVVCLMGAAILVYTKAPSIAQSVPHADPILSSYVAWVDQARLWLDHQAKEIAGE